MKFRINRLPRHASFQYTPRFYDPDKERIKNLKADYTEGDVATKLKSQIRQGLGQASGKAASQFSFRTQRSQQTRASNKRLFIIIFAMVILAYFMLESNVEGLIALLGSAQ